MAESTIAVTAGTITISLPVSSDPTSTIAQAALAQLTSQVSSGSLNLKAYNPSSSVQGSTVVATVPVTVTQTVTASGGGTSTISATQAATVTTAVYVSSVASVTVTSSGGNSTVTTVANLGTLQGANAQVINTDTSGNTVAVIGSTIGSSSLIAGGGSNTAYYNRSSVGSVLLTGGNTFIGNSGTGTVSATLTGGQSLGDGRAYIDATVGTQNVTVGNNGLVNVNQGNGGTASVQASTGTVIVAVSKSTVPASSSTVQAVATIGGSTINSGATPSKLIYIENGGNAFINPNASDVLIFQAPGLETFVGGPGSNTLVGGSGSATVFGGIGSFTGGTGGKNILLSGSINGVTTLIGASVSTAADTLIAQAGGDLLMAGAGTDVLAAITNSTVGNTFITGTGTSTVLGGANGNNTIGLNSGSAFIYGQHGSIAASPTADVYRLYGIGGSDTIGDYLVGRDVFKISAGYLQGLTSAAPTLAGATISGANLSVTLTDNTRITFLNVATGANNATTLANSIFS